MCNDFELRGSELGVSTSPVAALAGTETVMASIATMASRKYSQSGLSVLEGMDMSITSHAQ
jgi:hypothetical protein